MKYSLYPGCSAYSTARDMHQSTMEVAAALGIELIEPEGWTCCGSTPAHQTSRDLATALSAANLSLAYDMKMDMAVNCAACYSRLKTANHEIASSPETRDRIGTMIGRTYDGSVPVRHFLEILLEDIGVDAIRENVKKPLTGLRIACYYGCLLVRPQEIMRFDNPENPTSLDRIVVTLGGKSIDWPHKVECCGGSLSLTRTDVVVKLSDSIIGMAKDSGADCIAVACPMCQANLDLRQTDITRATGKRYKMPILYITQLMGLAFDIPQKKLGIGKLMVSPEKMIRTIR